MATCSPLKYQFQGMTASCTSMQANSSCTAATNMATMHSRISAFTAQSQHGVEGLARKQYASLRKTKRMEGTTQSHHAKPRTSSFVTSVKWLNPVPQCFRASADAVSKYDHATGMRGGMQRLYRKNSVDNSCMRVCRTSERTSSSKFSVLPNQDVRHRSTTSRSQLIRRPFFTWSSLQHSHSVPRNVKPSRSPRRSSSARKSWRYETTLG